MKMHSRGGTNGTSSSEAVQSCIAVSGPPAGSVRAWIESHDDSWLFIALYVGLAVTLSLVISLFWLVVVVGAHAALEWYVHWRRHPSIIHTGARVIWEVKLDIGLILLALVLTVYMELVMGVAGLSAVGRGVQASGRFIAWQRALRATLLTLDDAAQVARAAVPGGGRMDAEEQPARTYWGTKRNLVGYAAIRQNIPQNEGPARVSRIYCWSERLLSADSLEALFGNNRRTLPPTCSAEPA